MHNPYLDEVEAHAKPGDFEWEGLQIERFGLNGLPTPTLFRHLLWPIRRSRRASF
jgi:hypothetical protein